MPVLPALRRAEEILYASEATLRLVDQEMQELGHPPAAEGHHLSVSVGDLPRMLDRANQQILNVLSQLRQTRSALQRSAFGQRHATDHTIRDVQDTTSQQLNAALAAMVEMESRVVDIARLFDSAISLDVTAPHRANGTELPYDSNATVHHTEGRRALADEIVTALTISAA